MQHNLRTTAALGLFGTIAFFGCDVSRGSAPDVPARIRTPAFVQITGGNQQVGVVGSELRTPLAVRVVDSSGAPIAGQIVNFRVVAGGGSTFAGAGISDALGRVAERWTLGTVAGDSQRVEARAVHPETGAPIVWATFTATAVPAGIANLQKLGPDTQVVRVGSPAPFPPTVRAVDRYGNPLAGRRATFRVVSGGGSISETEAVTDSGGIARVTRWQVGAAPGPNEVSATTDSVPSVRFLASATAPPALPEIVLTPSLLTFVATSNGATTADKAVSIENGGSGTLAGLSGSIEYRPGDPAGWLAGSFTQLSAPAQAIFRASPAGLAPGEYEAIARIEAAGASNSPQFVLILFVVLPSGGTGASLCSQVAGASIVADDGTYLGNLTNKYNSNSIFNRYGKYGSEYSATSIWNEYGKYGDRYSATSAFNERASRPPVLVLNGRPLAYLSINTSLTPRVDPRVLATCNYP